MLKIAKYIFIIIGVTIGLYGVIKDIDLITLIGVAMFIMAFFLNTIIMTIKNEK